MMSIFKGSISNEKTENQPSRSIYRCPDPFYTNFLIDFFLVNKSLFFTKAHNSSN